MKAPEDFGPVTLARLHAALDGRTKVADCDLEVAARLVLAPRARQLPTPTPEASEPEEEKPAESAEKGTDPGDNVLDVILRNLGETLKFRVPFSIIEQQHALEYRGRGCDWRKPTQVHLAHQVPPHWVFDKLHGRQATSEEQSLKDDHCGFRKVDRSNYSHCEMDPSQRGVR